MENPAKKSREKFDDATATMKEAVGGPARLRIILLLAAVLALDTADKAAVSAVAGSLKDAFSIGNFEIGVLISAVSFVGAIGTLPAGVLVDRTRRERILRYAIALWAVVMVISGTATSFVYLLVVRIFLGIVTAVATPAVASLTGDFFPPKERGRIYGMILAGELVGVGIGFLLAGEVSSWLNWRWAFYSLAVPSGALVFIIWRWLPEPAREGQSRLFPGQLEIHSEKDVREGRGHPPVGEQKADDQSEEAEIARKAVKGAEVEPVEELILEKDPTQNDFWWAVKYVLSVRTNRLLIIASALGYFFFSGVRAFAMVYSTKHYDLSRSTVSSLVLVLGIGAVFGVVAGGRLADRWLEKGRINARVLIPGAGLLLSVVFIAPAIWITHAAWAVLLFTLGATALAAANSPIDAARLDIMHPRLWGRAESVRTALRMTLEGAAPSLFGFLSDHLFGGGESGLKWTFIIMLLPVIVAGILAIPARKSYPRDVATVNASLEKQRE